MLKSRNQALAEIAAVDRRILRVAEAYHDLLEQAHSPESSQAFLNLTLCVGDLIAEGMDRAANLIECLEAGRASDKGATA